MENRLKNIINLFRDVEAEKIDNMQSVVKTVSFDEELAVDIFNLTKEEIAVLNSFNIYITADPGIQTYFVAYYQPEINSKKSR